MKNMFYWRYRLANVMRTWLHHLKFEFFQNYKRYGNRFEINYTSVTEGGYYQIAINPAPSGLLYSATATAIGNQLDDDGCRSFTVTTTGALTALDKDSNDSSADCW